MKPQHIHQELLVCRTTSLYRKVLRESKNNEKNENMTLTEKLEQVCWNGLINEIIPEIIGSGSTSTPKMFIWGVYPRKSFLLIDLADTLVVINSARSLDPYLFLPEWNSN